jgi:hypothetical protein
VQALAQMDRLQLTLDAHVGAGAAGVQLIHWLQAAGIAQAGVPPGRRSRFSAIHR